MISYASDIVNTFFKKFFGGFCPGDSIEFRDRPSWTLIAKKILSNFFSKSVDNTGFICYNKCIKGRETEPMKTNYYFDMDGVLANFHKEPYNRANAISRNWIANLDPFMENIALVKELIHKGHKVYISSLAASEEAKQGKIEWLAKYLPEIPSFRIIIIVGYGNKVEHMKTKTGTLVDDKKENCRKWEKGGQTAIWLEEKGQRAF